MAVPGLTILNRYELTGTAEAFQGAVARLVARVETEGHPGVLSYRFFVNGAEANARAVIDYKDAEAWVGHHDIAMGWPEMTAMHAVARLSEVIFLGPLTPDIRAWIDKAGFKATIRHGNRLASGFQRPGV